LNPLGFEVLLKFLCSEITYAKKRENSGKDISIIVTKNNRTAITIPPIGDVKSNGEEVIADISGGNTDITANSDRNIIGSGIISQSGCNEVQQNHYRKRRRG